MYKHYAWNIFATSTVVTFLASIFAFSQTPIYRATATVVVNGEQIQANMLYLRSSDMIRNIVDRGETVFSRLIPDGATQGTGLSSWIHRQAETFYGTRSPRQNHGGITQSWETIVPQIQENLTIETGENPMWIDISFDSPNQQLAAEVVNLIARTYISLNEPEDIESSLDLSQKLALAEKELLDYLSKNPVAESSAHNLRSSEAELETLQDELTPLRLEISEQKIVLTQLRQLRLENPDLVAQDSVMLQDPILSKARQKREELALRWKEMTTRYGVQHLKMIALKAEITKPDHLFNQQITNGLTRLEQRLKAKIRVEQSLANRIPVEKKKQKSLRLLSMRTKALQLDVDTARRNFEIGHPSDASRGNKFRYSSAAIPIHPIKPNTTLILFSVFLTTSLLMGVLLYWKEQFSDSEP